MSQTPPATTADVPLRSLLVCLRGKHREPAGRTYHLHQLDGARLEAMVDLHRSGVRIQWEHGHGDCAITGAGHALLALLLGGRSAEECEASGDLTLFGDRDLIQRAPEVFTPRPGERPGSETFAVRLNAISASLIAAWAEAGGRPTEIAAAYGVDQRTVRRWQRRLGFQWQRPGNPARDSLPELWAKPLTNWRRWEPSSVSPPGLFPAGPGSSSYRRTDPAEPTPARAGPPRPAPREAVIDIGLPDGLALASCASPPERT